MESSTLCSAWARQRQGREGPGPVQGRAAAVSPLGQLKKYWALLTSSRARVPTRGRGGKVISGCCPCSSSSSCSSSGCGRGGAGVGVVGGRGWGDAVRGG